MSDYRKMMSNKRRNRERIVKDCRLTRKNADYIIDMGPGGGEAGGKIVAVGTPEDIVNNKNSVTGKYLCKL